MPTFRVALLLVAILCFLLAATGIGLGRVNPVGLGLACLAGAALVS